MAGAKQKTGKAKEAKAQPRKTRGRNENSAQMVRADHGKPIEGMLARLLACASLVRS